jgi:hypothetical protein
MSEVTTGVRDEQEVKTEMVINPYDESNWSDKPVEVKEEVKPEVVQEEKKQEVKEEVKQEVDLFEQEFGLKKDDFKKEYEELKKLKEAPLTKEEIKFANEQSEKLFNLLKDGKDDDVFSFLDTKRKLSNATAMPAADALKLHLQLSNPHYKGEDVEDVFEEKYAMPEKPEQTLDEEDIDYEKRVSKWQAQTEKIARRIERDAVSAKAELAKLNQELVLPDIPKKEATQTNAAADQELLAQQARVRENFEKQLESNYKNFNGFDTKVKDESVEIPISFLVPEEEKIALKQRAFDFDVMDNFNQRWFDKDNNPKVEQIMADLYILENKDKVLQGVANQAATKRLAEYIKEKGNIDVSGKQPQGTFTPDGQQSDYQKQAEYLWNNA